jgi:hypothetical protein
MCLTGCSRPQRPGDGDAGVNCTTEPCPEPCPEMEIEINNTPATNDDVVQLKCERPAHRTTVDCRIRAKGSPSRNATVVLTNPDGRLRFPGASDTTTTLTLPSNGAWVPFQISGEAPSNAIGDAVIEAHCGSASGEVKARKPVTVFWFDQAQIAVTPGGNYTLTGGRYTVTGGRGVTYSAQARIRPAGVDCSVPQISALRVGIMQNVRAGVRLQTTWDSPTITWNPGVARGATVTVPRAMRLTQNRPILANDSETSVAPLYDQPGKAKTLDANSLKPPIGCSGGAAATSFDTPSNPAPPTFSIPATTSAGTGVGTITYTFVNTRIDNDFITWVGIFHTVTNHLCAHRERTWSVHADSAAAGPQRAAAAATDSAPTMDPVTAAPFSNDVVNDPANRTVGPAGAATTTFTR